jgi:hypothetical protein
MLNKQGVKKFFLSTENYLMDLRDLGQPDMNLAGHQVEDLAALYFSDLTGQKYTTMPGSNKAFDIADQLLHDKIEVKSVYGSTRSVENMRDKDGSDRILVVWFETGTVLSFERVMLYETQLVLEAIKENGNKKGAFTASIQKNMFNTNQGLDITEDFQTYFNNIILK